MGAAPGRSRAAAPARPLTPRQNLLLDPIHSVADLEEVILRINPRYRGKWSFAGLHHFFAEHCTPEESARLFHKTLPAIAHLVRAALPRSVFPRLPAVDRRSNFPPSARRRFLYCGNRSQLPLCCRRRR